MCAWWAKNAIMVQDPKTDLYICSECGYQAIPEIGPIHEDKIEAGNERSNQKPYIKSVRLVKKTENNKDNLFGSFTEAWNS